MITIETGTVEISRNNARKIVKALPALLSANVLVFDVETTGLHPKWHEIVSIAAKSPDGVVDMYSLIMPKRPKDLLKKGNGEKSAYDINGIHPDDLSGSPTFAEAYPKIRQALADKHWVCWNADFDVRFLDTVCEKRGLERIPRAGVTCAMKLLSPLAGLRGQRRGRIHQVVVSEEADDRYRWQKLGRLASRLGIDSSQAHNAAADVNMTLQIMEWASENLEYLPAPSRTKPAARKAKPVYANDMQWKTYGTAIDDNNRRRILNKYIIQYQAKGLNLESRDGFSAVFVSQKKTNHIFHLLFSLITGGLWLFVWIFLLLTRRKKRQVLYVDELGAASLEPVKR